MSSISKYMKLPELHNVAEKYNISIQHVSQKTGKMINKTKELLVQNIIDHERLQKQQEEEIKRQQEEEQEKNHETLVDSMETQGQIFYDDEISLFLIWTDCCIPKDEDEKNAFLEPSNIESKFDIKLTFGSFLRFKSQPGYIGSDFYIIGHDKKIIECDIMCNEESMMDTEYIIIPREITKYLKDALTFFNLMNSENYRKKIRTLPKKYSYEYSLNEDTEYNFDIGCVQLSSHDIYLHKHISTIELDSPILFDYRLSRWTDYDYKLFVFIPYLGKNNEIIEINNYSSWIDTYIDIYGAYSFLKNNNVIDFQILKSIMTDYQTKKSTFSLKIYTVLNFDDEPPFGLSLEKVSSHKYEKDNYKVREAIYQATFYEAFLAEKNLKKAWSKNIWVMDISFESSISSSLKEVNNKYDSYFYTDEY